VTGGNENAYNYPNDPINFSDLTGEHSYLQVLIAWAVAEAVKLIAKAVLCSVMLALCPLWTYLIPGIVEALKALYFGIIDHLSAGKVATNMIIGFFEGVAMAGIMKLAVKFGLKPLVAAMGGMTRVIRSAIFAIATFVVVGGLGLKRR
jgi:hypothetical protein